MMLRDAEGNCKETPLGVGDDRKPPSSCSLDDTLIDTAKRVLEIVPGERPLLPEFGCRIHLLPPLRSAADRQVAAALLEEALDRWVPKLRVDRAEVVFVKRNRLDVSLRSGGRWHDFPITHRSVQGADEWADDASEEATDDSTEEATETPTRQEAGVRVAGEERAALREEGGSA